MKPFSGLEYVKLDIANNYGKDKETYQERLNWFEANKDQLDALETEADSPLLFKKGVNAYRDALAGRPSGHMVGFDATNSGGQIMSVLSGCLVGAINTNLTGDGVRHDLYTEVTDSMREVLEGDLGMYDRKEVKTAVMTALYNSKAEPENLFGEDTKELGAFWEAMERCVPGALEVMDMINECWQSDKEVHMWILPDGHTAYVPVTEVLEAVIEIDELDHHQMTVTSKEVVTQKRGVSLVANIIHS